MSRAHRLKLPGLAAPAVRSVPATAGRARLTAAAWLSTSGTGAQDVSDDDTRALIDRYLNDLAHDLIGPAPVRAGVLSEVGDGLRETVDSYRAGGLRREEAVKAAIAEFGEPRTVATAFRSELGVRQARRTAFALMGSGPLIGAAWLAGVAVAFLPHRQHLPWVSWSLPLVALAIMVGVPSLILTIVSTGRIGFRLRLPASLPPRAAGVAGAAAVTVDATLLSVLAVYALTAAVHPSLVPLAPAVAVSAARICLAVPASRRCLAATAAP